MDLSKQIEDAVIKYGAHEVLSNYLNIASSAHNTVLVLLADDKIPAAMHKLGVLTGALDALNILSYGTSNADELRNLQEKQK